VFQIREVDDALRAKLADIRKDFPGVDLRPCADESTAPIAKKS
jgi:hypothetical protein